MHPMTIERPPAPLPVRRDPGQSSATMRLGIIDADSGFVHVLSRRLDALGWEYRVLGGPARIDDVVAMRLSCLIVDPALLGADAWDYLDSMARELPSLGLIVHTARSSVAQRVRGLRLGADDWVAKPCHPEEMIARVEAVVRRRRRAEAAQTRQSVSAGELEIRPDQFQVFVSGQSVELTRREFELIELLSGAEGRVLEREEIYQRVWGYAMAHGDRSVDVFVRKLRRKLQSASPGWSYIHTHFGIGYRFAPEPAEAPEAVA
jgi:DNA-binding response OmpR family regulator